MNINELLPLINDPEVRNLPLANLRMLMGPFGFEFKRFQFDAGERIYVTGPNVKFDIALEDGYDFTCSALVFARLRALGQVPSVVFDAIYGNEKETE